MDYVQSEVVDKILQYISLMSLIYITKESDPAQTLIVYTPYIEGFLFQS